MSVTPPRALKAQRQQQQQQSTSLVEVVAALIPLIDQFPHLQWKGLITGEDFVELWFPFIADYVQNGLYDPPTYITDGGRHTITSPSRQQRMTPAQQQRSAGGGHLWRSVSPSRVVRTRSPPSPSQGAGDQKPPKSLSSFLNSAAFAATRERANSLAASPATKQLLNSGSGMRCGSTSTSNSGALTMSSPPPAAVPTADPNTVASIIVLRSFVSAATSLVMYQLKLLDSDLEMIVNNSIAKRRESLVPTMLPSFLAVVNAAGGVVVTSPSRRTLTSPERSLEPPSRRALAGIDRSSASNVVVSFALGSANALLQSFNGEENDADVQARDVTSAEGKGQSLGSRLFPQSHEGRGGTTMSEGNAYQRAIPPPQRKSNVHFSTVLDNSGDSETGELSGTDFFSNSSNVKKNKANSSVSCGDSGGGGAELEFLSSKDSIQGESRSRLIREIQRIWSTPKGRRPGLFAKEQYQSFPELKVFVETLLSALYSSAAEPSEADRISWQDLQGYLTDSAIAYNTQLSLRDVPIFVEEATATVSGSVTYFGTVLCDQTVRIGPSSTTSKRHQGEGGQEAVNPSPSDTARNETATPPPTELSSLSATPQSARPTGGASGGPGSSMLSRMVLTVQQGVSNPSLLVVPPGVVQPHNQRTTTIPSPSMTIKAIEYLEHVMCFVCCSDRAVHFYDFRYGANMGTEITSFSLDALSDSPSCMIWLPDHNRIVVGGISGYMWKIAPPSWSAAKREWRPPVLHHCSPSSSSMGTESSLHQSAPTGSGSMPLFQDTVHIIRRAFHPTLLFVACRSSIVLLDIVRHVVKLSHHAHNDGIHHIAGLVFNQATQYLLCTGETLQIFVWLSPNLARQSPVKMTDMIAPHSGHIIGLETHPTAPIVVSMDFHGAVKIWDLDSMACSQNIFLQMPRVLDVNRLHLRFYGKCICTVVHNKITLFKVDEETVDSAPSAVLAHPKGGSFVFSVNRDLVQLSSAEGKKEIHHQNISDVDTIQACFAGSATIVLLNSLGAVTMHSISSGKLISSYGRKQLKAEGVDLVYCHDYRRVVVPTASPIVWFLPTEFSSAVEPPPTPSHGGRSSPESSAPQHNHLHHPNSPMLLKKASVDAALNTKKPFHLALDPQDSAGSCVAIGRHEKQIFYCVGTVENSVNIFALSTNLPRTVALVHRIPPPSTSLSTSANNNDDGLEDGAGNLEPDVVTSLILSLRNLVVGDSAGVLRMYRPGSWTYLMRCHVWELVLSAGRDLGSITPEERADFFALSQESDVAPKILCSSHYKLDSVIAVGDSLGRILFLDVTRSDSLTLLHWWQAHRDGGGGVNRIAVERETIATVGDHAALYVWSSAGAYLGNVWGRCSTCISAPVDQSLPEWLDEDLLIGEGSVLLRRQSSRFRRNIGSSISLMRVARTVSVVERVARLSKLRLVGFDGSSVSATMTASQQVTADSVAVSRSLNFSSEATTDTGLSRRGQSTRKSQVLLDQLPSVSFAHSIDSAGFDEDAEFQTSFDASRRSSVASTLMKVNSGGVGRSLTLPPAAFLDVPMPTGSNLLDVVTPRSDDEDSDGNSVDGAAQPSSFLVKVETSARMVSPTAVASSPASPPLAFIGGVVGEQASSTTSSAHDHSTSLATTTHLRPLAWKANDVAALDAAFRETLGQQRIFSCASQVLGQPNTMRRTLLPARDVATNLRSSDAQHAGPKPRKSVAASIASTTIAESKPRLTLTLQRSGNIVTSPQRRRSRSSMN
jgi:hypothetical protein